MSTLIYQKGWTDWANQLQCPSCGQLIDPDTDAIEYDPYDRARTTCPNEDCAIDFWIIRGILTSWRQIRHIWKTRVVSSQDEDEGTQEEEGQ